MIILITSLTIYPAKRDEFIKYLTLDASQSYGESKSVCRRDTGTAVSE